MNNRLRLIVIFLGTLVVIAVYTFPYWQPLLEIELVEDGFPGLTEEQRAAFALLTPEQQEAYEDLLEENRDMAIAMARAALSPDSIVPTEEQGLTGITAPEQRAVGLFSTVDDIRTGSGTVRLYQFPDNTRVLRLEDFRVTNGPNLHIYLTRNPEPREPEDIGTDYIDLGELKANTGNQNYPVPIEVDFSVYRGVIIYSASLNIVYSSASMALT